MKITLIGGTGRTGREILQQALERGHEVRLIARQPDMLGIEHERLQVWTGMPNDPEVLQPALCCSDAVLSALNVSRTSDWPWAPLRSPKDLISDSIDKITRMMAVENVRRIITISAWGVNESSEEIPAWFAWFIRNSNIRFPYRDHARHENILRATDLDWTILRPSGLTNARDQKEVIISKQNVPKMKLTVSREQVARFILDCLEQGRHSREVLGISGA
ncbi:NAD(P)-dependent oxidoreductase [Flavilitoribacter nigricans]|uniref:NAD(P)-binding domain-containing protein n=1 Tax=Flavilitoribacter nigricans (strain ATCC 23147 / DSM 23189 / NBRC 102662 / NCIMB 1420 / SS-2) TaxID=1122177 RepID=A0A2D0N170_FLAN2|nr:NAD(P)H-binding protein [Flavilitoribacter nigricans]PHN02264.1 hypothetical protein CRP01_32720 [Flavilitoribacter nigricans DSM 23189 = NBRC 102662]